MNLQEAQNIITYVINGGIQKGLFQSMDNVAQVIDAVKVLNLEFDKMHGLQEQLNIANDNGIRLLKENEALVEGITDLQRQVAELQKA